MKIKTNKNKNQIMILQKDYYFKKKKTINKLQSHFKLLLLLNLFKKNINIIVPKYVKNRKKFKQYFFNLLESDKRINKRALCTQVYFHLMILLFKVQFINNKINPQSLFQ